MGSLRAEFLLQSVSELRANLQGIGSDLVVRVGRPRDCITALVDQTGCVVVCAQEEVCLLGRYSTVSGKANGKGGGRCFSSRYAVIVRIMQSL